MDKVNLIYKGNEGIRFICAGLVKDLKPGDLVEGVPADIFNKELKADARFCLVEEKPAFRGKAVNKMQQSSKNESEEN